MSGFPVAARASRPFASPSVSRGSLTGCCFSSPAASAPPPVAYSRGAMPVIWIALIAGTGVLRARRTGAATTFGSARWMDRRSVRRMTRGTGLIIGRENRRGGRLLRYGGPAHLITIAPTRTGKGVGTIIPNLLADRAQHAGGRPQGRECRDHLARPLALRTAARARPVRDHRSPSAGLQSPRPDRCRRALMRPRMPRSWPML